MAAVIVKYEYQRTENRGVKMKEKKLREKRRMQKQKKRKEGTKED